MKKCIKRYFELLDSSSDANVFCNREILHFSHEDRYLLLKTQEEFVTLFEKIIKQGAEKGIFKVKNPNIVAHNIVVLGADWCLRRWYLKNRYTLEQYTANQIEMVLKNILASC